MVNVANYAVMTFETGMAPREIASGIAVALNCTDDASLNGDDINLIIHGDPPFSDFDSAFNFLDDEFTKDARTTGRPLASTRRFRDMGVFHDDAMGDDDGVPVTHHDGDADGTSIVTAHAVRFHDEAGWKMESGPSEREKALEQSLDDLKKALLVRNKVYWLDDKGVDQGLRASMEANGIPVPDRNSPDASYGFVRCNRCGAWLPVEFCGKGFFNYCPVCNADLRPEWVVNGIAALKKRFLGILDGYHEVRHARMEPPVRILVMFPCSN